MELSEKPYSVEKEIDILKKKRNDVLKQLDQLFWNDCEPCTKLQEARDKGLIKKDISKDRKNFICDACPAHHKITKCGKALDHLMFLERCLR